MRSSLLCLCCVFGTTPSIREDRDWIQLNTSNTGGPAPMLFLEPGEKLSDQVTTEMSGNF